MTPRSWTGWSTSTRSTPRSRCKAQQRILGLGDERLAFAGAYHGWGFHEDGALSGLKAAARLGRDWDQLPVNIGAVDMRFGAVDPDLQPAAVEAP